MEIPEELAQNYLRRRMEDLNHLERALMAGDYKSCEEIGHRLKGSARTYGFDELEHLASSLEEDALKKDKISLTEDVNEFRTWVNKYIN